MKKYIRQIAEDAKPPKLIAVKMWVYRCERCGRGAGTIPQFIDDGDLIPCRWCGGHNLTRKEGRIMKDRHYAWSAIVDFFNESWKDIWRSEFDLFVTEPPLDTVITFQEVIDITKPRDYSDPYAWEDTTVGGEKEVGKPRQVRTREDKPRVEDIR